MSKFLMFIFEELEEVSDSYHSGGGAVIIASSIERTREVIGEHKTLRVTDEEWAGVVVYQLADTFGLVERVFIFPDAGCC